MGKPPPHLRRRRTPSAAPSAAPKRGEGLVGQRIADRYLIEERIASGGFGAVYGGKHVHMGHRVAIKVLHPKAENLPGLVERFRREAIVGAHVRHANVTAAIDFGTLEDGSYYLVTEHVDGQTLKNLLKQGKLAPARALSIAAQLGEALEATHAMGIAHRDVKPANIMLVRAAKRREPTESVKLIDFGFAKVAPDQLAAIDLPAPIAEIGANELTVEGMMFGTVAYMPPESWHGMDHVDARSDLYALGLILYEMLSGRRPFEAPSDADVFKLKLAGPPVPLSDADVAEPLLGPLRTLLDRLLDPEPDARFQSAQELLDALDALPGPTDQASSPPANMTPTETEADDSEQQSDASSSQATSEPSAQPAPTPKPGRSWPLVVAVVGVVAVGAIALRFVRAGSTGDEPQQQAQRASAPLAPSAQPSASSAPTDLPPYEPSPRARALVQRLSAAERARDWQNAHAAFAELVAAEPRAFETPLARAAAANTLSAMAQARAPEAETMIATLETGLGAAGPDVLFHVVQFQGGSLARQRAVASLAKPAVRKLASPTLALALDLKAAGCNAEPSLLRRALADGDSRALLVLKVQHSTCRPSHERGAAFRKLEAKLSRGGPQARPDEPDDEPAPPEPSPAPATTPDSSATAPAVTPPPPSAVAPKAPAPEKIDTPG